MSASSRPFIDTNVIVYLASADAAKADRSESIVASGGVVSVQVLNEFVSVARRALALTWPEVREALAALNANLDVVAVTPAIQARAVDIAEARGFHIYDAAIVAAAIASGCDRVLTEDLQHGQIVNGVRIENPYLRP